MSTRRGKANIACAPVKGRHVTPKRPCDETLNKSSVLQLSEPCLHRPRFVVQGPLHGEAVVLVGVHSNNVLHDDGSAAQGDPCALTHGMLPYRTAPATTAHTTAQRMRRRGAGRMGIERSCRQAHGSSCVCKRNETRSEEGRRWCVGDGRKLASHCSGNRRRVTGAPAQRRWPPCMADMGTEAIRWRQGTGCEIMAMLAERRLAGSKCHDAKIHCNSQLEATTIGLPILYWICILFLHLHVRARSSKGRRICGRRKDRHRRHPPLASRIPPQLFGVPPQQAMRALPQFKRVVPPLKQCRAEGIDSRTDGGACFTWHGGCGAGQPGSVWFTHEPHRPRPG